MLNPEDLEFHAEILENVIVQMACSGGMEPTGFVRGSHNDGSDRTFVILSGGFRDETSAATFMQAMQRTSIVESSPRSAIVYEGHILEDQSRREEVAEYGRRHGTVAGHEAVERIVLVHVESDAGTTSSTHRVVQHHAGMAELLPCEATQIDEIKTGPASLSGFHVHTSARDSEAALAFVKQTEGFVKPLRDEEPMSLAS
jgi:hypothetical protein